MSFKTLSEHVNHYVIQGPDGKPFKMAKKGLTKELHERVKSLMVEPVKMSDGGAVPDYGALMSVDEISKASQLTRPDYDHVDASNSQNNSYSPWGTPTKDVLPSFGTLISQNNNQMSGNPIPYASSGPENSVVNPPISQTNIPAPVFNYQPGQVPVPVNQTALAITSKAISPETSNQVPAPGVYPTPAGPNPPVDPLSAMPGYSDTLKGIQGMAAATSQYSKNAAQVADQQIKGMQETHELYHSKMIDIDRNIQNLSNDVMNGKVDPNRVWTKMNTGNKITAAIAIALGGIGAGLTGKSNAALDVINKTIDNDIDAQKVELGKKQNLLSHYMQQYNNLGAAENATKLHLATIAGAQLQKFAAQQGSAQAAAQASMLTGQMKQQYAPILQKQGLYDIKKQMSGANGEGGLSLEDEQKLFPVLSQDDKEYSARRVPVNFGGKIRVYQHTGQAADAEKMRIFEAKLKPISDAVRELDELGPSASIKGTDAWNKAQSIREGLATSLAGLKSTEIGSSKINDVEANRALEQIGDPTAFSQLIGGAGIRNQAFFKDLNNVAESVRRENLVGYRGRPETHPYGGKK